jgi:5-methylcytosine-specific restriction endonuclease McrA
LGEVPTSDQMDSDGGHSAKTYERRFGSWNAALEAAGFPPNVNTDTTRAELLDEIDQLADELGRPPTTKDMTEEGRFGVNTYLRTIGSFVQARCEAGHAIHKTVEVECEHCGQIVEKTESDVQEYEHHFCCRDCYSEWKSNVGQDHPLSEKVEVACDWCGDRLLRKPHKARDNERHFCDRGCMAEFRTDRIGEDALAWKGGHDTYRYYGPNWDSQRQKALERDGYCCQSCGSVESELDCGLHVHHITPLREFGDGSATDYKIANALENLVSLCAECHPKWENIPVRPSVTRTATE